MIRTDRLVRSLAGCQLPSALVSGWVLRASRCRIDLISTARGKPRSLATAGCGFSSVTRPFRVLTFMAAITSAITDAESA